MTIKHVWKIDSIQSRIAFKVKYMLLGVVTGEFRKFSGTLLCDEEFSAPELQLTIETRSFTTFQRERDHLLRGPAFFHAGQYPQIRFTAGDFYRISSGGLFELNGQLTIKEQTAPVTMMVNLISTSQKGGETISANYKVSGCLLRSAFGLKGNDPRSINGLELFADEVLFYGEIRVNRKAG